MSDTPAIYVARPIDLVGTTELPDVIRIHNELIDLTPETNAVIYSPKRAFMVSGQPTPYVAEVNRHALAHANGLLALFPEVPGVGVAMEIEQARLAGIPTLVVSGEVGRSWSLAGAGCTVLSPEEVDASALEAFLKSAAEHAVAAPRGPVMRALVETPDSQPRRAYDDDAGFDLASRGDWVIYPGEFLDIPCGVSVQLPEGVWAMITGRSSTLRKHNLLVSTGVIDTGYRGPLFAGVKNLGERPFQVESGMRLAQLILFDNVTARTDVRLADTLDQSPRGASGFGSTGV